MDTLKKVYEIFVFHVVNKDPIVNALVPLTELISPEMEIVFKEIKFSFHNIPEFKNEDEAREWVKELSDKYDKYVLKHNEKSISDGFLPFIYVIGGFFYIIPKYTVFEEFKKDEMVE